MYDANPALQGEKVIEPDEEVGETTEATKGLGAYFQEATSHIGTFFSQRCWAPGFCLSMLYFTVLNFGILMTGYLKWWVPGLGGSGVHHTQRIRL